MDDIVTNDDMRIKPAKGGIDILTQFEPKVYDQMEQGKKLPTTQLSNWVMMTCIISGLLGLILLSFDKCSNP